MVNSYLALYLLKTWSLIFVEQPLEWMSLGNQLCCIHVRWAFLGQWARKVIDEALTSVCWLYKNRPSLCIGIPKHCMQWQLSNSLRFSCVQPWQCVSSILISALFPMHLGFSCHTVGKWHFVREPLRCEGFCRKLWEDTSLSVVDLPFPVLEDFGRSKILHSAADW